MEVIKEKGKKGFITYKVKDKYIYSIYDPYSEAGKYLNTIENIKKTVITCCGADYVNEILLKKNIDLIISFEPLTFENTLSDPKLVRIKELKELEKILLNKNINSNDISLIIWQPLMQLMPDTYLNKLKDIKDILLKINLSNNTAKASGFIETKNFIINAFSFDEINILNFFGSNKNLAVILSSGPSLEDNIDLIDCIKDHAVLFALPSSLSYLQYKKIYPDYVCAVDPGYATFYHLLKYKHNINLIAPMTVSQSVFRLKNIKPVIFNYCSFFENIFFDNIKIISSPPEGSVFINLLRILSLLDFKEVFVIGQDFGFKNNKSHAKGGSFENEFIYNSDFFKTSDSQIKKLDGCFDKISININKKVIKTNLPLKIYFDHFINNKFDIDILLHENSFNPIGNSFKKINKDYILSKYNKKDMSIFNLYKIKDINQRKKSIKDKLILLKNKDNNNEINNIFEKAFIDINNQKIINKLKKFF